MVPNISLGEVWGRGEEWAHAGESLPKGKERGKVRGREGKLAFFVHRKDS